LYDKQESILKKPKSAWSTAFVFPQEGKDVVYAFEKIMYNKYGKRPVR